MDYDEYQFIVLTQTQFDHLKDDLGWDIGEPRRGPDGRLLTNRNGNVPFAPGEIVHLTELGVAIVMSGEIESWLVENNWEEE